MTTSSPRIGQRYEQLRELGTGGTAVVYEAMDHVLHRRCAVKLLLDVPGAGSEARSNRLRQEAAALATLDHPRVVRVYDLGEHDGRPFLAMEYVPGGSLADRLVADGPFPPGEAVDRIIEVLDALTAAHVAGIVHRDVKPHNVLLREDGTAALADFGIARQEAVSHTRTGVALGSVDYMAPEQRIDARKAGPAADVYGVGCTLFHLLSGETPVDLYLAPSHSPRWEAIPGPLRHVLRRATSVDPGDRYASAVAMAEDLRTVRPALQNVSAYVGTRTYSPAPVPTRAEGSDVDGASAVERTPASPARIAVIVPNDHAAAGSEEWSWAAGRGPRAGRTSVAVALGAVAILVLVLVFAWPMLETRLKARGAEVPVERGFGVEGLAGQWRGSFGPDRHRGELVMERQGASSGGRTPMAGFLDLDLDGNQLRVRLDGHFTESRGALVLEGSEGRLTCDIDGYGVCRGQLRWGSEVLPFAVVHMGQ